MIAAKPKAAPKPKSFQDIILTLQTYWADQGCAILQPYDMEVGAGTLHPATVLRALGPKPWRAAYVQPSRRPSDGRYGENPNRLGHYYQFQVILKPNPINIQDLYLESLYAIGIDPEIHDIRFVEDDWENPLFSGWGRLSGGRFFELNTEEGVDFKPPVLLPALPRARQPRAPDPAHVR